MKTLGLIIAMLTALCGFSQKTYLSIYETDARDNVIMYPPGTPFELRDAENNLIFTEKNYEGEFKIKGEYTLSVSPSWKVEKDIFRLTEGSIVVELTEDYYKYEQNKSYGTSHGITVNKTLIESSLNPGMKNVKLSFSNGIVFTYTDGKAKATLNGKALKIKYKYMIYSDTGITKLSFNPKTGVVWWVFEPKVH